MARKIRVPSAEVERRRVLRIFPFAPVSTSFIPRIRRVNNYTVVGGIQKMQANIGIRERSREGAPLTFFLLVSKRFGVAVS